MARHVPVTARADGSWRVSVPAHPGAADSTLDVTVTHDGIRELLHATIAPPAAATVQTSAAASGGAASGVHRQIVWWILNIAIVLIAALALSRRRS